VTPSITSSTTCFPNEKGNLFFFVQVMQTL
jgi:hypothetical protein